MITGCRQAGPTPSQQPNPSGGCREGEIAHLRGRAGVEGVLWRAQGRSFSLESAAVLGLAQLPAKKHNRGVGDTLSQGHSWNCTSGAGLSLKLCLEVPQSSSCRLLVSDRIWEGQSATGKYQRQIGISQLFADFCGFLVMEGASWSNRVEAELLDTGKKFPVEVGNPFPAILFFFLLGC